MEQLLMTLQIVAPIFTIVGLGIFAKKRNMMTSEQISGLQQFVVQFGIPCVFLIPALPLLSMPNQLHR